MCLKKFIVSSCGIAALFLAPTGWTQQLKIGYVDVVKVIEEAPQGDAALKKLESEFGPRDRQLRATQSTVKSLEDELEKNELVIKESERREKERELRDLKRKLKRQTQEFREDYSVRRNEELRELEKIVHKAIVEIAKSDKYSLIIHQGVVYADNQIDITEHVLKILEAARQGSK
jgi:outer membrane protein